MNLCDSFGLVKSNNNTLLCIKLNLIYIISQTEKVMVAVV